MRCMGKVSLEGDVSLNESRVVKGTAFDALLLRRLRPGEAVTVADAKGGLFRARVIKIKNGSAELLVFEDMLASGGEQPDITLLQAMPDKERMELIIQKTTDSA
ncbi:MAG: 16S rRNA (uracil(1498)-N(3))-methyltransferase [Deltaproteobacteria bacterium]|nr:16S rRNA (uracil(1498)-N(3))-methyltransferase [Deltaproteobacteria bacterium]